MKSDGQHIKQNEYEKNSHQERRTALSFVLITELPSTWNLPSDVSITVGAVKPPRAPVNVCRLFELPETLAAGGGVVALG